MRKEQQKDGHPPGYDGKCRSIDKKESIQRAKKESFVIRMKFPNDGVSRFNDLVYGDVTIPNNTIDDQVLIKSDGLPTYHFAVVIDDHLMEITHVVRGREYLADTPKNIFLYNAYGWDIPEFVHVPHILKPVGKGKLGKRDGSLPALGYLKKGYLPDAVLNYIAMIGWAPQPDKAKQSEIYDLNELIEIFDFNGIQKTGGRYDPKKLDNTNGKHVRLLDIDQLSEKVIDWAQNIVLKESVLNEIIEKDPWELELEKSLKEYLPLWKADMNYFTKALNLIHERITYFSQIPELINFFYDDHLKWTEEDWKAKDKSFKDIAIALEEILPQLETIFSGGDFSDHDAWEKVVRGYADKIDCKHGELFLAIRSATTGRLQSPPLLESFDVMGWDKVKKNIEESIVWLRSN